MTKEEYIKEHCKKCVFSLGLCDIFNLAKLKIKCSIVKDVSNAWDAAEEATIEKFRTAMEEWCNSMSVIDAHDIDEIIAKVQEESK